jgi:hypothetical protein
MTAETDLRPVLWRAPKKGGGWMYFDHEPTHLTGVEPLLPAHAIAPLQAEIEALRDLCGMAYQLAGAHDAPEEWLDALSDAAAGRPFSTNGLLPYIPQRRIGADSPHTRREGMEKITKRTTTTTITETTRLELTDEQIASALLEHFGMVGGEVVFDVSVVGGFLRGAQIELKVVSESESDERAK